MSAPPPIIYAWDGTAMVPHARFARLAESSFTAGHAYRMIVEEERSHATHAQFFAAVHNAWMNLPDNLQLAFPTPDHLRKHMLIAAGFCTISRLTGGRQRIAVDDYAIVVEEGGVTTVYQAKSQSYRAMGKAEFKRSRDAVLENLAGLLGVTPDQLLQARVA